MRRILDNTLVRVPELLPCEGDFVHPKPAGGSETGHMLELNGRFVILKMGIHLTLLGSAVRKTATESPEEGKKHLGYLFNSFDRLSKLSEDEKKVLKAKLEASFATLLEQPVGLFLTQKAQNKIPFSTDDIEQLFLKIIEINPELKPVFALPSLVDLIAANTSQTINNQFQSQFGPVADASVVIAGSAEQKQVYTGSAFIAESFPFNRLLLKHFTQAIADGALSDEAIERAKASLAAELAWVPIKGLVSAVLMRLIFGESADLGPDNMLLTVSSSGGSGGPTFNVLNIDLTGFRFPRKEHFRKFDESGNIVEDRLGWEELLREQDPVRFRAGVFDSSVFSNRFVSQVPELKNHKDRVFSAITDVLKAHVVASALAEKNALVAWFATLDPTEEKLALFRTTFDLNESVPAERRVDDHEVLIGLIDRNAAFLADPIYVAKELCATRPLVQSGLREGSMFKPAPAFDKREGASAFTPTGF